MNPKLFTSILTFILFFAACNIPESHDEKSLKSLLDSEWETHQLPNSDFTISLPFSLRNNPIPIPNHLRIMTDSINSQKFGVGYEFTILSSVSEYKQGADPNLNLAARQSLDFIQNQEDLSDFWHKQTTMSLKNASGILQTGFYKIDHLDIEFDYILIQKENKMATILMTNNGKNENGREMRERIRKYISENN